MSISSRLRGAALVVGLLAPLPALAQAPALPSAEGAKAVAEEVRAWLARQLGGIVDVSALPLQVVPEGEAYRMALPLGGNWFDGGVAVEDAVATLAVKPLDGGRWQVLGGGLPQRLSMQLKDASGEASRVARSLETQETTGVYDPSLKTASHFVSTITGYTTETHSKLGVAVSRIGRMVSRTEWAPSGPGRVTVQGDSQLEGYSTTSPLPGVGEVKVTMGRLGGSTRIENFDGEGLGTLLRTAYELGSAAKGAGNAKGTSSPQEKEAALKLVGLVFSMLDALETDYSYEDIKVEGGPMFEGSLRRFGMGLSAGAPDGKVDVKLRLSAEGLDSPMIPPGPWVEFIPHKLSLTPRVSGVSKDAVLALLRTAIENDGQDFEAQAATLLAANPVALGIEDLLIDLGPMRLKGSGSVEVARLDELGGEAVLRATGFDALIRRANAVPELKMAAPVLIFLKGIATQEGTETVWRITYADRKVLVNDTDLSDLLPAR
jgi:hypothetical protein